MSAASSLRSIRVLLPVAMVLVYCASAGPSLPAAEPTNGQFSGPILVIDPGTSNITVRGQSSRGINDNRVFQITQRTPIVSGVKTDPAPGKLTVGDWVNILFTDEHGIFRAQQIERTFSGGFRELPAKAETPKP